MAFSYGRQNGILRKGKGFDDGVYLTSALLRKMLPRGFTNFCFTKVGESPVNVVLRGFLKFTGAMNDVRFKRCFRSSWSFKRLSAGVRPMFLKAQVMQICKNRHLTVEGPFYGLVVSTCFFLQYLKP